MEKGREILLIIKTLPKFYKRLEKRVRALHSYSVPEILALPVAEGSAPYLEWMRRSLQGSPARGRRG
jgi:periplasmic divalent cation tolerance protein